MRLLSDRSIIDLGCTLVSGQCILLIVIDRDQLLNVGQAHDFPHVTLRLQHAHFSLAQLKVLGDERQQSEPGTVHKADFGHIQDQMPTAFLSNRLHGSFELFTIRVCEISRHLKDHTVRDWPFFRMHRHEYLLHSDQSKSIGLDRSYSPSFSRRFLRRKHCNHLIDIGHLKNLLHGSLGTHETEPTFFSRKLLRGQGQETQGCTVYIGRLVKIDDEMLPTGLSKNRHRGREILTVAVREDINDLYHGRVVASSPCHGHGSSGFISGSHGPVWRWRYRSAAKFCPPLPP